MLPQLPNAGYRCGSGATASWTRRRSARAPARAVAPRQEGEARRSRRPRSTRPTTGCRSSTHPTHEPRAGPEQLQARLHALPPDRQQGDQVAPARARRMTPAPRRPATCTTPPSASAATSCSTRWPTGAARIANGRDAPGPAAPEGRRAEHRHHPVELGRQVHLRPRRGRDRPEQPHAQRERPDLGRGHRQRLAPADRSGQEHLDQDQDPDAGRVQHPVVDQQPSAAAVLRLRDPRRPGL